MKSRAALLACCSLSFSVPAAAQIAELAVDLTPGSTSSSAASSSPNSFRLLAGSRVIFSASDFLTSGGLRDSHLWVTTGTAASTLPLPAAGQIAGSTDSLVYSVEQRFSLDNREGLLWRTDGTTVGTFVIPGLDLGEFQEVVAVGETLVVIDGDGRIHATEGTAETTRQLGASLGVPFPFGLTAVGERIVFFGNPGFGSPLPNRPTLWEIDVASGAGRSLLSDDLLDFNPSLIASGGKAFIAAMGDDGSALWVADPVSGEVTPLLAPGGPVVNQIAAGRDGEVLFTGFVQGEGIDLWHSDGTVAGTGRLTDLGLSFGFPFVFSGMAWARPPARSPATSASIRTEIATLPASETPWPSRVARAWPVSSLLP